MDLLWPGSLLLLGIIPLLIGAHIWSLRRRRPAMRYSSLGLLREALPGRSRLRRHLPAALFTVALASLVIALSRPVAVVSVPTGRATIILAMDVSRSMCSTDIQPNRLLAASEAALSFIQNQKDDTQIGVVAFAGYAELIQPPTTDQEVLEDVILSLTTGRRTAVGSAILTALEAIAEIDPHVAPVSGEGMEGVPATPVPDGAYAPSIIVLLTDGASNQGPFPLDVARLAAERGVRVYTIGFGTARGASFLPRCGQPLPSGDTARGGGLLFGGPFGGSGFRRGIDEDTLRQVADVTSGAYHSAESAGELEEVFQNLPTYLITTHETREISVAFAALGGLLAVLSIGYSLLWNPLP